MDRHGPLDYEKNEGEGEDQNTNQKKYEIRDLNDIILSFNTKTPTIYYIDNEFKGEEEEKKELEINRKLLNYKQITHRIKIKNISFKNPYSVLAEALKIEMITDNNIPDICEFGKEIKEYFSDTIIIEELLSNKKYFRKFILDYILHLHNSNNKGKIEYRAEKKDDLLERILHYIVLINQYSHDHFDVLESRKSFLAEHNDYENFYRYHENLFEIHASADLKINNIKLLNPNKKGYLFSSCICDFTCDFYDVTIEINEYLFKLKSVNKMKIDDFTFNHKMDVNI